MARIGYARVSTVDQDLDTQLVRLKAEGCGVIRSEKVSGGSRAGRSELATIIEFLRPRDELMVTRLDLSPMVAQLERRFIKERQREGIERAKAERVYRGGKRRIDRKQLFAMASAGKGLPLLRNPWAARACMFIVFLLANAKTWLVRGPRKSLRKIRKLGDRLFETQGSRQRHAHGCGFERLEMTVHDADAAHLPGGDARNALSVERIARQERTICESDLVGTRVENIEGVELQPPAVGPSITQSCVQRAGCRRIEITVFG
jgi:hypothetical protein